MGISKKAIYSCLCLRRIKRISSQNGFHCGVEVISKRKGERESQVLPCRGTEKLAPRLPLGEASNVRCHLGSVFHLGVLVMGILEMGWNFQQAPPRAGSLQVKC